MEQKRFYYNRSNVYGWCVYDRHTHQPAYEACADLLPPLRQDETGTYCESPICQTEWMAVRICSKLNIAYKKKLEEEEMYKDLEEQNRTI